MPCKIFLPGSIECCPGCGRTIAQYLQEVHHESQLNWRCLQLRCAAIELHYGSETACSNCGTTRGESLRLALRKVQEMGRNALSIPMERRTGQNSTALMCSKSHTLAAWLLAAGKHSLAFAPAHTLKINRFRGVTRDQLDKCQALNFEEQCSILCHFALDFEARVVKVRHYNLHEDCVTHIHKPNARFPGRFKHLFCGMSLMVPVIAAQVQAREGGYGYYSRVYVAVLYIFGDSAAHMRPFADAIRRLHDDITYGAESVPVVMPLGQASYDAVENAYNTLRAEADRNARPLDDISNAISETLEGMTFETRDKSVGEFYTKNPDKDPDHLTEMASAQRRAVVIGDAMTGASNNAARLTGRPPVKPDPLLEGARPMPYTPPAKVNINVENETRGEKEKGSDWAKEVEENDKDGATDRVPKNQIKTPQKVGGTATRNGQQTKPRVTYQRQTSGRKSKETARKSEERKKQEQKKRQRSLERVESTPNPKRQKSATSDGQYDTDKASYAWGNVDVGSAYRKVRSNFDTSLKCLSCRRPHQVKEPATILITDSHGAALSDPDIFKENLDDGHHLLIISADSLTPLEAGVLLEAMSEGSDNIPKIKGITDKGHACVKAIICLFTQSARKMSAYSYITELTYLEDKMTHLLKHQLTSPRTRLVLHPMLTPGGTKGDLYKYLAITQWMTRSAVSDDGRNRIPYGLSMREGPFVIGHHGEDDSNGEVVESTVFAHRLPCVKGGISSGKFTLKAEVIPEVNGSHWRGVNHSAQLTAHGAARLIRVLQKISARLHQAAEKNDMETDVEEEEAGDDEDDVGAEDHGESLAATEGESTLRSEEAAELTDGTEDEEGEDDQSEGEEDALEPAEDSQEVFEEDVGANEEVETDEAPEVLRNEAREEDDLHPDIVPAAIVVREEATSTKDRFGPAPDVVEEVDLNDEETVNDLLGEEEMDI